MAEINEKDLRVVRTRKSIREAFLRLLQEKDVNSISITEVANLAMIDRKTFYSHYSGIYALVDEIENDVVSKIGEFVYDIDAFNFLTNTDQIVSVLKTITEHEDFVFARALSMDGNARLAKKFVESIKTSVINELRPKVSISEQRLSILVDYNISGMISCYQNWLRNGRKIPIETLCKEITKIAVFGLEGCIKS